MSNIASMSVKLGLDAAGFKAGLDKAANDAKSWSGMLGKALTFALPAVGVGGLFAALRQQINEFDAVGDAAARAGVELQQFMNIVGTMDSGDTQIAISAMEKMRKTMAELATGDKATTGNLKAVGLEGVVTHFKSVEENLRAVAQAYMAAATPAQQYAIAQAAVGKAAREFAEIADKLADPSGGFNKFTGMDAAAQAQMAYAKEQQTKLENMWSSVKMNATVFAVEKLNPSTWLLNHYGITGAGDRRRAQIEEGIKKQAEFKQVMNEQAKEGKAIADSFQAAAGWLTKGHGVLKDWVRAGQEFTREFKLKRAEESKQMLRSVASPFESLMMDLEELGQKRATGALGEQGDLILGRMAAGKFLELEKSVKRDALSVSPLLGRGSAEEGSFRARFEQSQVGGAPRSVNERVADVLQRVQDIEARQLKEMADIAAVLKQRLPVMAIAQGM